MSWLFRKLFRTQLNEITVSTAKLKTLEVEAKSAGQAAQYELDLACQAHTAADELHEAAVNLIGTLTTHVAGFTSRCDQLIGTTSTKTELLTAQADAAVNEIKTTFDALVDARIKAEVVKWVFAGGAGRVGAVQYCPKCLKPSSKWRVIPDEGPVCEKCCIEFGFEL